jgi:hypothetical protein
VTLTSHTTPFGLTFKTRPTYLVPERLRRPVAAKLLSLGDLYDEEDAANAGSGVQVDGEPEEPKAPRITAQEAELSDELNDLLAVALIVEWTHPAPISVEALLDLPKQDYDTIRQVVAPFIHDMMPDFEPTPEPGTPSTP